MICFIGIQNILYAQCPILTALPKSAKTIEAFIPTTWFILDSAKGDFNADKLLDIVLVIANEKENVEDNFEYECNRAILILQKTKEGYILSSFTKEGVLCKQCGGIFGDPYAKIFLEENVLTINHYGGSNWRWTQDYTFRFQQKEWQLIGISKDSYFDGSDCDGEGVGNAGRNLVEVNFSTSKIHVIQTKGTACKPYKDVWLRCKKKPLISLSQFDVSADYLPIKIN
jgi:hypothetical protein